MNVNLDRVALELGRAILRALVAEDAAAKALADLEAFAVKRESDQEPKPGTPPS